MANWLDVTTFLNNRFDNVEKIDEDTVVVPLFFTDDGRSQRVYVHRAVMGTTGEEWVDISSPFAKVAEVDLLAVLSQLEGDVCGGLVKFGEFLLLRQSTYLSTVDAEEILRPIQLLAGAADDLERQLGRDAF